MAPRPASSRASETAASCRARVWVSSSAAINAITDAETAARLGAGTYVEHRADARLGGMRARGRDDASGMGLHDGRAGCPILILVPAGRVERLAVSEERGERAHHLWRFIETPQELVRIEPGRRLERFPAAVDQDHAGAGRAKERRCPDGHDRAETVSCQDHARRVMRPEPRALRHGDHVACLEIDVVGAVLGRRVGQAMAAQVHRHEASPTSGTTDPASHRCPDPGRLAQTVDCHDRRLSARIRRLAPVEEMDTLAVAVDHEPRRLERRVRLRDVGRRELHRP